MTAAGIGGGGHLEPGSNSCACPFVGKRLRDSDASERLKKAVRRKVILKAGPQTR